MTNLIDATENTRLDDLTAYNSTLLNAMSGDELTAVGAAVGAKRLGRADTLFRDYLLNNTHPDDLVQALASRGKNLAALGVTSISR